MSLPARLRIEWEDQLRWHPAARAILCQRALRKARRTGTQDMAGTLQSIDQLCAAARLAPNTNVMQQIEGLIHDRIGSLDLANMDWRGIAPDIERRRIEKSVLVKPYLGPKEKGVVFISFENQWARLLWKTNVKEFTERYTLVISPTWSPPHNLVNCVFPAGYPAPFFCLISSVNDLEIFPRLSTNCVMVPLYSSSWVDPGPYQPVPFEKKNLDIFMLANFGKYKRHFLLFKALREMPASVRVLLIGQNNGARTRDSVMAEARAYGVQDRFELLVNVPDATVFDAFARAKTTLILSRREGSCVAVAESMFANTPVGLFEDGEIGSRVFINESTGRFLNYRKLGRQLMEFIASANNYSPRAWAEKNISCFRSTEILNAALKKHALSTGQEWTQDIATLQWRPNPQLVLDQDRERLKNASEDIHTRFGLTLG